MDVLDVFNKNKNLLKSGPAKVMVFYDTYEVNSETFLAPVLKFLPAGSSPVKDSLNESNYLGHLPAVACPHDTNSEEFKQLHSSVMKELNPILIKLTDESANFFFNPVDRGYEVFYQPFNSSVKEKILNLVQA